MTSTGYPPFVTGPYIHNVTYANVGARTRNHFVSNVHNSERLADNDEHWTLIHLDVYNLTSDKIAQLVTDHPNMMDLRLRCPPRNRSCIVVEMYMRAVGEDVTLDQLFEEAAEAPPSPPLQRGVTPGGLPGHVPMLGVEVRDEGRRTGGHELVDGLPVGVVELRVLCMPLHRVNPPPMARLHPWRAPAQLPC
jgi:hypothetical protein